ncbi:translation initiation factor 2 [Actinoplanes sp. NPDC024001]|uniref:translation initiation factor 2 n=1 Tax=Actinoplanes sp. NPDC024001 TaxID=3154598 RepID=UPI0033D54439
MFHQHFLSASGTDLGPLDSGERVLWRGNCAVAEYGFDEASSLPRWTLPEETDVLVTDRRVRFAFANDTTVSNGELFWLWPQHLRVQPGNRETGRNATVTQIQLVCTGPDETFPALVFAGGDVTRVGDADRLANVLRQAIARFRVENAEEIGVPAVQARMLSRLVIGPEFSNYQGGEGQTVTLLGAVPVPAPEPAYAEPVYAEAVYEEPVQAEPAYSAPAYSEAAYAEPAYTEPAYTEPAYTEPVSSVPVSATPVSGNRAYGERPGVEADALRAEQAIRAEQDARYTEPDLASRAASLAARVASLVSNAADDGDPGQTTNLSAYLSPDTEPGPRR